MLAKWLFALVIFSSACATYEGALRRSERAFDENEYDRTLAILRDLEPDLHHLSQADRARYAYLRGMADFRIGYKTDARHWLSLASAWQEAAPGALPEEWTARINASLKQLNEDVYINL